MQITQRIPKFSIVIISLIWLWIVYKVGIGITHQNLVKLYLIMGLSILIAIPYIIGKIGSFPLLCGLVFMYWIPFSSGLWRLSPSLINLYPTEFGVWMLCMGTLIYNSISPGARNSTVSRFPFFPFLLFIGGSLITYLATEHYSSYPVGRIRTFCLLPALFCFLCIYLIKTIKQAEHLLWIFLISAGLSGLIALYAPQVATGELWSEFEFLEGRGRLWKIIKLPLFGILHMSPESTSVCFAFIVALSFNIWLNYSSFWGRSLGAGILAISAYVIVQSQGRAGLIAGACSIVVITVLSLRFRKYSISSFSKSLWKAVMVILLVFGAVWYYASISIIRSFRLRGMTLFTDPIHAEGLSNRLCNWNKTLHVFFDHPLFGVGLEGFPKSLDSYGNTWFAHNLYLYLLLSFGIIGFIGFLWVFVRYTKACWSGLHSDNSNRQILCIGGVGCATVLFVAGTMSCICGSPWQIWMVWIPFGITMAAATLRDEPKIN